MKGERKRKWKSQERAGKKIGRGKSGGQDRKLRVEPCRRLQKGKIRWGGKEELTINVPVVYMVRYKVVLWGDYP